jgi:hypothetical protein
MEANTTQEASSISPPGDAKPLEDVSGSVDSGQLEDNPYLSKS